MTQMSRIVTADSLSLVRGNRRLFKSLSFTLAVGQAIHLRGKNGSGKTSLFKVLTGTLAPTKGALMLFEQPVADFSDYQKVLYLGHQSAIKHDLTVQENIAFNATIFDHVKVDAQQLNIALDAVGLWQFCDQLAGKLSAGQKRRVMLARLWLADATLWLLDEPLTALDVEAISALQACIATHLAQGGSVIFTSHQPLMLPSATTVLDISKQEASV